MKQKKIVILITFTLFSLTLSSCCKSCDTTSRKEPDFIPFTPKQKFIIEPKFRSKQEHHKAMQEAEKAIKEKIDKAFDLVGKASDAANDAYYNDELNGWRIRNDYKEEWELWLWKARNKYHAWLMKVEELKKEGVEYSKKENINDDDNNRRMLLGTKCILYELDSSRASAKKKLEALRAGDKAGTLLGSELKLLKVWEKLVQLMAPADNVYDELSHLLCCYYYDYLCRNYIPWRLRRA
jgi:hypothetical protein